MNKIIFALVAVFGLTLATIDGIANTQNNEQITKEDIHRWQEYGCDTDIDCETMEKSLKDWEKYLKK